MEIFTDVLILISRICISSLFLWTAWEKLINWNGTIDYMKQKNMPYAALSLPVCLLLLILGGFSILLGFYTRVGALLLIAFILPAMVKFHDFWNVEGDKRKDEKTFFMKDLATLGALVLLCAFGSGRFSIN